MRLMTLGLILLMTFGCWIPDATARCALKTPKTLKTKTKTLKTKQTPAIVTISIARAGACDDCNQYRRFSWAVAKQEGFFIKGSIPNRDHNPGDLKSDTFRFPGQVGVDKHGHAIFKNDYWGWAALEHQVKKMCAGGGRYSPDMTLSQVGKGYAKDWRRWSVNVAKNLKCTPQTTLSTLFDITPTYSVSWEKI